MKKTRSKKPAIIEDEIDLVELPGNGEFDLEVVGESHYQKNIKGLVGPISEHGLNVDMEARLILEYDNQYDENAVRVEIEGKQVGYLSRAVAPLYREQIRLGGHPKAIGIVKAQVRAWKDNCGVWLDIPVEIGTTSDNASQKRTTITKHNDSFLLFIAAAVFLFIIFLIFAR